MAASAQEHAVQTAGLLEVEDARRLILGATHRLSGEPVELPSALGRVLAEDVAAPQPVPAFDGSAMDGYAVRSEDLAGAAEQRPALLELIGESRAGTPAQETLAPGQAIAISTGAVLPAGADAVVRVEDTRRRGQHVEMLVSVAPGWDVRRAGEDMQAGQTVLRAGTALGPVELGVLASLGRASALCARRPRLSVLVSGDELLAPGQPARAGGVRDSNSLTISSLARRAGAEVVRVASVGDEAEATRAALAEALAGVEVAVICGGVSVGVHDHVRPGLEALGARAGFWGLALKPGRPTWFGTIEQTLVFGLPGNPVSAMVTFVLLVQPALRALLGLPSSPPRLSAVMECDYEKPAGRAHAVRCTLSAHADGWHARPTGPQGSHILTSVLAADGLAIVPSDTLAVRAGERLAVEPLRPWMAELS